MAASWTVPDIRSREFRDDRGEGRLFSSRRREERPMSETETGAAYGGPLHEAVSARLLDKGVLVVTLSAPERLNAFNQAMKRDLIELMARVQMDDAVRVVVFTGAGKAFCAGDQMG